MKKILAKVLAAVLLVGMLPFSLASAADDPVNLALDKTYSTNDALNAAYGADKAFDNDTSSNTSRWSAKGTPSESNPIWLAVDFGEITAFNQVVIYEFEHRMVTYQIEYSDDGSEWNVALSRSGEEYSSTRPYKITLDFPKVEARYVRINILTAKDASGADKSPTIYEMQVFYIEEEEPIEPENGNLALNKTGSTNSAYSSGGYPAQSAFDGIIEKNGDSRWAAAKTVPALGESIWLSVDLGEKLYFDQVIIYEMQHRMTSYQIEYSDDGANWQIALTRSGETYSSANPYELKLDLPLIEARYVRINIFEAKDASGNDAQPNIYEMEVYNTQPDSSGIQSALRTELEQSISREPLNQITTDVTLPGTVSGTNPAYGGNVVWSSTNPEVVDPTTGKVTRTGKNVTVTLTAAVTLTEGIEAFLEIPFELTVLKGEGMGIDTTKNLALNKKGSTNNSYSSGGYGAQLAFDGQYGNNNPSRWAAATTIPAGSSAWLCVDLGEKLYFDQVVIYEMQHRMRSYQIEYSDDGANWQVALTRSGETYNSANPYTLKLDLPLLEARYVRINIFEAKNSSGADEKPNIYEMEVYLTENHLDEYVQKMMVKDLAQQVTKEDSTHITLDLNMPGRIVSAVTGDVANITWRAEPAGIVDTMTGELQRTATDTPVHLVAELQMDASIFTQEFDYVIKAAELERALIKEQSFAGMAVLPETYSLSQGNESDVSFSQNRLTVCKTGGVETIVSGDLTIGSGFYAAGFVPMEVILSAEAVSEGEFVLKNGKDEIGGIAFADGQYTAFAGSQANMFYYPSGESLHLLFNLDAREHYLYIYALDNTGERQFLAAGEVKEKIEFADSLVISNNGSGSISLQSVETYMEREAVLDIMEQQFTFDKISSEPVNAVNSNLSLFTSIGNGVAVKWTSSNPDIISETGEISGGLDEQTAEVTANVTYGQQSFSKTFAFTIGAIKQSEGKTITSSARAASGYALSNMLDSERDTVYRTTGYETDFSILVDLKEKMPFNEVRVDEVGGDGKILQYSIEVSSDQKDWKTVQTGGTVGEQARFIFELCNERYVRFQVLDKEDGAVGIAEFGVYLQCSPEEIIDFAFRQIQIAEELTDGVQLPQSGIFGTKIAWSTNSENVEIAPDGTVSVTAADSSQVVILYADVTYKDAVVRKEVKSMIVGSGTTIQRPTRPTSGGSGGGGSSGGARVGNAGLVGAQTTPADNAETQPTEETLAEEVNGHWAQTEITFLIQQGIVRGDENGLHLQEAITRAEFMALLIRSLGIAPRAYVGGFEDVSATDWYADTVQAAVDAGIAQGDGEKMMPNDVITREEMTKMLAAVCADQIADTENTTHQFTDSDQISAWANSAVGDVATLGIIKGFEDGSFRPQEHLLREQAMVAIYRLLQLTK